MGPDKAPHRRIRRELRACKNQEIITPAENPSWVKMYKSCRREVCRLVSVSNTSKRAVVRLLYTGELFLQSHLIVCKWLRAASLHFRHVPEALTTCLTAAMCDRIVPITCTGKSSIPFARLSSIFHIRFPILFWFLCCLSLPGTRSCNQKGGGRGTLVLGIQCTRPTDNTLNLHSSFSRLSSIA